MKSSLLLILLALTACSAPDPGHIVFVDSLAVGPATEDELGESVTIQDPEPDDWNRYKNLQRRFLHFKGKTLDPDRESVHVQIAHVLADDPAVVTDVFSDQSQHAFVKEGSLESWIADNGLKVSRSQVLSAAPGRSGATESYDQKSYLAGVSYRKSSANDMALPDHEIGYVKTGQRVRVRPDLLPEGGVRLKLDIELRQLADFIVRAVPDPMDPSRQVRLEVPIVARGSLSRELTFRGDEVIGIRCGPRAVILVAVNVAANDIDLPESDDVSD